MKLRTALVLLAAFFVNQDSYAASPEWKEAKMSQVEQDAAREQLQEEFHISIQKLMSSEASGSCETTLADNIETMGGDMAGRLGLINSEGIQGKIDRNELTATEFDGLLTQLRASRISMCSLAYLPRQLN